MGASCIIPAGVIGGFISAVFGFLDWRGIPTGTRASQIGLWHGLSNVIVVLLFALCWLLRPETWKRRHRTLSARYSTAARNRLARLGGLRPCATHASNTARLVLPAETEAPEERAFALEQLAQCG
jgi:hypothetical protein